ncbi:DUF692 domain-containing protein [Nocardioides flavescens]|nr:DUF692 domain-containing protein [Nocardioides flavescens]
MSRAVAGVGAGWRTPVAGLLADRARAGRLGFVEVVAENVEPTAPPAAVVALHDAGLPVVTHGVTLGLAGAERPDAGRLARLAAVAGTVGSPLVSEHAAFVRAAGSADALHGDVLEAGHLLPPPRTRDALAVLVDNVREAQAQLPVPLALENVAALVSWPEDELDEPAFLTGLVERTGCGLVLDVANLFASATARGTDPLAELRRFPLEAVSYVHVAGGTWEDGLYLDTHAHPVPDPVLALLTTLVAAYGEARLPLPGVMLERDSDVSPATVGPELDRVEGALASATGRVPT